MFIGIELDGFRCTRLPFCLVAYQTTQMNVEFSKELQKPTLTLTTYKLRVILFKVMLVDGGKRFVQKEKMKCDLHIRKSTLCRSEEQSLEQIEDC